MRTLRVRGALITFFAVTGVFGSVISVEFDGMQANVQTHSAEARMHTLVCLPDAVGKTPKAGELPGRCDSDLDTGY